MVITKYRSDSWNKDVRIDGVFDSQEEAEKAKQHFENLKLPKNSVVFDEPEVTYVIKIELNKQQQIKLNF